MASHKWTFKARFRTKAYSWHGTALASKRLKEAVREIRKVAKVDPVLGADGTVALMQRLWPSLQEIDTSSGALGTAVYRTLEELIPVLIAAPADIKIRSKWLEHLYEAVANDGVQYLSPVEEQWGQICVHPELAGQWADRLITLVRDVWSRQEPGGWVIGATICLSSLLKVGRYAELEQLLSLQPFRFWPYDKFMAEALLQQGQLDEAIAYAESHRNDRCEDYGIVHFCERVLLEAGRHDEAYRRYGLLAVDANTNLARFRKIAKKYPQIAPRQVLVDLIEHEGNKGKWFAAAKDASLFDIALECAKHDLAEPSTLIRAAKSFSQSKPEFAAKVALFAIKHLLSGRGYEPTTLDILSAHTHLMASAHYLGQSDWARAEVEKLLAVPPSTERRAMHKALIAHVRR